MIFVSFCFFSKEQEKLKVNEELKKIEETTSQMSEEANKKFKLFEDEKILIQSQVDQAKKSNEELVSFHLKLIVALTPSRFFNNFKAKSN